MSPWWNIHSLRTSDACLLLASLSFAHMRPARWHIRRVFDGNGVPAVAALLVVLSPSPPTQSLHPLLPPVSNMPYPASTLQVTSLVHLWQSFRPSSQVLSLPCRRGLTPIQHCIEAGKETALRELLRGIARDAMKGSGREVTKMRNIAGRTSYLNRLAKPTGESHEQAMLFL